MASRNIQTLLSYHCLTGPLGKNPFSDLDKVINKLRLKYRSYIVEYDIDAGAVCLPNMFGGDFGDQIGRYAILTDPKSNKFEGWKTIRDFYGIDLGAWITLVFVGDGVKIRGGFELKTSSKEKKIEKSTKRQKNEITRLQLAMASSKGEQFQNATKITRHQLAMTSRRRAYSPWRVE
ncbi:hypothetical protein MTR_2g435890 [Medicago truncatula]|uniref:Uncharacterized protein n=1 Tax=Medicago truncatula TaxID=3880 RepID=A0A072V763_MEDTR|nr:hypothetical protein MTR_2g435890 [Medicago truncatula]